MTPAYLAVRLDDIPADLQALPWVLWRPEHKPGARKPTKVPYQIADPEQKASTADPTTWGTFADAVEAHGAAPGGIGVVLTRDAGITCIDLDHVYHVLDEKLDERAERIVRRYASWTERSPSGTGVHIFVRGAVERAIKSAQIEVYSTGRYIAVTGHRWPGTPAEVREAQAYLDALDRLAHPPVTGRPYTGPTTPPPDDLAGALLAKLEAWGVPAARLKRWSDGYLVELRECPWADEHSSGRAGAAVMIHASGALDFTCLHAHCGGRTWREFRSRMESTPR
jgi:hypothetical protein